MDNTFTDTYIDLLRTDDACEDRFSELKQKFAPGQQLTEAEFKALVQELLSIAIIDEQLAELNYLQSYSLEQTVGKSDFDPEFEQHEEDEREHKYDLINRVRELDSNFIFTGIDQWVFLNSRGTAWKQEFDKTSANVLLNRLKEEEEAVEFYTVCVDFTRGTSDTTTYTLFKKIKEDEEEHVKDLRDLAREYDFLDVSEG
jgi:bacterioferritin (cytochrome b1)